MPLKLIVRPLKLPSSEVITVSTSFSSFLTAYMHVCMWLVAASLLSRFAVTVSKDKRSGQKRNIGASKIETVPTNERGIDF